MATLKCNCSCSVFVKQSSFIAEVSLLTGTRRHNLLHKTLLSPRQLTDAVDNVIDNLPIEPTKTSQVRCIVIYRGKAEKSLGATFTQHEEV